MTDAEELVRLRALDREHVFYSWSAQRSLDPLFITHAQGCHFWDGQGNRWLDFASQFVHVNIGHSHPKVIEAIQRQAAQLSTVAPNFATEPKSRAAELIAGVAPAGLDKVFFTNGGTEANEHAVRMARLVTKRPKVLSAYRSYHGATSTSIHLTGEPRRWANDAGTAGVAHFFGPFPYRSPFHSASPEQECERALEHLEQVITFEGPDTIAAVILEPVVGSAGILVPPPGYLAGVRALCDRFGIVFIADEVMSGFGRTGRWFGVDNWDVVPDLITFAKGVNSGYVPLGGVILSERMAAEFADRAYPGGLTYSGHPLACAAAVGAITAMHEEGIVDNARHIGETVLGPGLAKLAESHPSVGEARGIGVFWALDLVKDGETKEPLVAYGPAAPLNKPQQAFMAVCKQRGLWPFLAGNRVHIAPPCVITEELATEGLAIIDEALGALEAELG
jgi:taurine--2-oxoglutarate transaminase